MCGPDHLEAIVSAAFMADLSPGADWLEAFCVASGRAMSGFSGRQLALLHMALTRLGCRWAYRQLHCCWLRCLPLPALCCAAAAHGADTAGLQVGLPQQHLS